MRLKDKKILVGITGSIAAYKTPLLIRLLKKEGALVQVIVTPNAKDFVTPLTLSTLSGNPVFSDFFNPIDGSWNSHVEMGRWADLFVIAPASAATLSKMAYGLCDNLLTTTYLSAKCPVFFAPAMDLDMFAHPSTTENILKLVSRGNKLIEAQTGELASGLCGAGRMEEPEVILEKIVDFFSKHETMLNRQVLITAGPTFEAIDPVRFIGNHSTGKMGFAIAEALAERGAKIVLISGPVNLTIQHSNIQLIRVHSALEMYEESIKYFAESHLAILAAAVADYRPSAVSATKIKKNGGNMQIELEPTTDILKSLGANKKNQFLMGFALETDHELENAQTKLIAKNCDAIVLNSMKDKGAGFGSDTNKITILGRTHNPVTFDLKTKKEVAEDICNYLEDKIIG
jgi:phosphopantothenoylcysteine decarboxylase/phosphopantothenate--cysteine ligase